MAVFLIDYENVQSSSPLYGAIIDYVKAYSNDPAQIVIRTSCIAEAAKIFKSSTEKRNALIKSLTEITSIDAKRPEVSMKFEVAQHSGPKTRLEKLMRYFRKEKEGKR